MVSEESEKLQALRQEVRAWLRDNLPEGWGTPEYVGPERGTPEGQAAGKAWVKKLYDAGYTGFTVPKEYGGIERSPEEVAVIREEIARTGAPPPPASLGPLVVIPTLLRYGKEWQKKRFIPKILTAEECWCECFSEPDAGSDLANIQKSGVRDGDEWVVNGQSVWTSSSKFADWGLLPVKTDLDAPRHRNLSFFFFDCKSPGFTVKPLRQMSDDAQFSETFFDDMRVPHANMIGEEGRGWYVAMTVLEAERGGGMRIGETFAGVQVTTLGGVDDLVELAKNTKRRGKVVWEDPAFRQRIAQFAIENEAMRYSGARAAARLQKGIPMGDEVNIGKHFSAESRQRRAELTMEIIGAYSQLVRGSKHAIGGGQMVYEALRSRGATIEAGTSEINRNVIAERILGLPR